MHDATIRGARRSRRLWEHAIMVMNMYGLATGSLGYSHCSKKCLVNWIKNGLIVPCLFCHWQGRSAGRRQAVWHAGQGVHLRRRAHSIWNAQCCHPVFIAVVCPPCRRWVLPTWDEYLSIYYFLIQGSICLPRFYHRTKKNYLSKSDWNLQLLCYRELSSGLGNSEGVSPCRSIDQLMSFESFVFCIFEAT